MTDADGEVVVVTGAGRGIGRAYAEAFAARGAAVVAIAEHLDGVAETAASIERAGGTCRPVAVDVADEAGVIDAVDAALHELAHADGGIDALVNNAGIQLGRWNTALPLPLEDWYRIIDVNLLGALNCVRACRRGLAARRGAVVNQSSIAAYGGAFGAYGVTKLALNGLTMTLAHELAPEGIRVNGVAPGVIATPEILEHGDRAFLDDIVSRQLVCRLGAPDDLVGLVLYLCSDAASFVTGQTFTVDGGLGPRP